MIKVYIKYYEQTEEINFTRRDVKEISYQRGDL